MNNQKIDLIIMSYENEFEIFYSNINQAARSFYYHQEIQRQVHEDGLKHEKMPNGCFQHSKMFQSIQTNSQFWTGYNNSSIVFFVITLGRIFDNNKNSHRIEELVDEAKKSGLFTKKMLRERKMKGSDNAHEWIDCYMMDAQELSCADFKEIIEYATETRSKWESVKGLRNKIFAHQDIIDEAEKSAIYEKSKYSIFEEIIERLLTLECIFFNAFNNGKAPDFNYKNSMIKNAVVKDVQSLLERLSS